MKSTETNRPSRALILRLVGTFLSLVLLVYLLSQQGWDEILAAFREIPLWRFIAALAITMISRLAVAGRWHVLLKTAGERGDLGTTTRLTFAGLFASNFLPTTIGGDVVRLAGAIQLKYDAATAAASLVVDRLIGMAGMAMALPFGIPALIKANIFSPDISAIYGYISYLPFAVFSAAHMKSGRLPHLLQTLIQKSKELFKGILEALARWVRQPGTLVAALLLSWVHMLCLFSSIWLMLDGMAEPIDFWTVAGLWTAVYFITLIPISINGYGLQEISMAVIFSSAGGVSSNASLATAILVRTLTMLASLPGALYVPGILAGRERERKDEGGKEN